MTLKSDFKQYLTHLGYSRGICRDLPERLASFIEYHNIESPESARPEHISSFYKWLHERTNKRLGGGLSGNYIYQHIYALKLFFRYQEETGEITYNPISAMKFKRPEYSGREPLSREEIRNLFEASANLKETAILHYGKELQTGNTAVLS